MRNSTKSGVNPKKVFISKNLQFFTNSEVKTKRKKNQKGLYPKIYTNFHEFLGEATNTSVVIAKSTKKKQFLLTNSGVITNILGISGLELHSSSTKFVNFFWAQSSLGRTRFSFWGGTSSNSGGHGPEMPSVARGLVWGIIQIKFVTVIEDFIKYQCNY